MALDLGTLVGYLELDTKKWEGPLSKVGGKMPGWMAGAGAIAATAVAAAFSVGLAKAINADAANDKIAAQLGLTEDEAAKVGAAAAGAYGNAFGENMDAVRSATAGVVGSIKGMREASEEEIQGITEKVLTLSDGFEMEADRISQVVGQMLSSGLASSAEEGLDLLTAALQKVPPAVREDLVDAVDEYGPFFDSIGMSGDEAMSALVASAEKGMYGIDKTGDAIKEFGIRATDMSATSVAAYEAAGLSAEDMSAAILAGGDEAAGGFQQIVDGLLGIEDPTARANAAIGLFGTPLEDLGVNEIPAFLESLGSLEGGMGDVSGSAQDMADTMQGNAAASWEKLQRSFEQIITTIAGQLLPVLEPLLEWAAENPELLTGVAIAVGVLAAAFGVLAVAQWAVNAAMFASPITWIILAIVALIAILVLLIANWDAVWAWLTEVWNGFVTWLTESLAIFAAWWNEMWAGFGAWISEVWNGFVSWITGVWQGFVNWLMGIVNGIVGWWNGIWSNIGSFIQTVWGGFVSFIQGVWGGFVGWIQGVLNGFIGFWSGIWNTVKSSVVSIWEGIIAWFEGIPDAIFAIFTGATTWLYNIGKDIVNGLWNGLKAIWGTVSAWFEDTFGGIIDVVSGIFDINSPSKVFRSIGLSVGEGFVQGLDRSNPEIDAAVEDAFGHIAGDASGSLSAGRGGPNATNVVNYYAAEDQSLSAEEALFSALGGPRSPFGGGAPA